VDDSPTQEYKKARVKELFGSLPSHVSYVAMDLAKGDLLGELRRAGYSERAQTFFLWEGGVVYLPESVVIGTLHVVRDHAAPGSRIAFDYVFNNNANVDNPDSLYARWGEPWLFGFPTDGAAEYVREEGLEVVSDTISAQNVCIASVPRKK